MTTQIGRVAVIAAAALIAGASPVLGASAKNVEDFYNGRTMTVIASVGAGPYDLYARVLSMHIARHIPGSPSIIVQNMAGAGGLKAANYAYNVAARDGTVLLAPLKPTPLAQLMRKDVKYDAAKFQWIGSVVDAPGVIVTWKKTSPVKTFQDAFKATAVLTSSGKDAETFINPTVINALLGTKFKVVLGYPGMNDMQIAMERGEAHGVSTVYGSILSTRPQWIRDKQINYVVQIAEKRIPELPDVPTVFDFARTDEQREVFRFICLANVLGRAITAPPGVPADRVEALRAAFDATMKDPVFLAEAKKRGMELNPTPGKVVQADVEKLIATPPAIVGKVKAMLGF